MVVKVNHVEESNIESIYYLHFIKWKYLCYHDDSSWLISYLGVIWSAINQPLGYEKMEIIVLLATRKVDQIFNLHSINFQSNEMSLQIASAPSSSSSRIRTFFCANLSLNQVGSPEQDE